MKRTVFTAFITSSLIITVLPFSVFAHVVVTPSDARIGEEVLFSISVPNEKEVAVTQMKLAIPRGVSDVTPTVKDGWDIKTTTVSSTSEEIASITWSNGTIPQGQRQDFTFSAQAPESATKIQWKAYQTYADGTSVAWDQTPSGSDDSDGTQGPYSVTTVTNDLTESSVSEKTPNTVLGLVLSMIALLLSIVSLFIRRKRKN